jgi:hypothetical protein
MDDRSPDVHTRPSRRWRVGLSWWSLTILAALVFGSRPAYALPNPFILIFNLDILIQILIILPLLIRGLESTVSLWLERRIPRARMRTVLWVTGAAVLFVVIAGPTTPQVVSPSPTACKTLSPELAQQLALPSGSFVVDPRSPAAFAAYHLKGSCQVDPQRLVTMQSVFQDQTVYLIEDREISPSEVFGGKPPPWADWRSVSGGLRHYYKPDGAAVGFGDAPEWVVDQTGRSVSAQLGPFWFMGSRASLIGRQWRELPRSALGWAAERNHPIIDLRRNVTQPVDGALVVPPWNARLSVLTDTATGPLDHAVIVCYRPQSCAAAEALVFELGAAHKKPVGYIRLPPDSRVSLERFSSKVSSTFALGLVIAWLVGLLFTLLGEHFSAWIRKRARSGLWADGLELVLPLVTLVLAFVCCGFTRFVGPDSVDAFQWPTMVYDAIVDRDVMTVLLVPLLFVGTVFAHEDRLRRSSRWFWGLALLALAVVGLGPRSLLATRVVDLWLMGSVLFGMGCVHLLAIWRSRRRVVRGVADCVRLEHVSKWPWLGGKILGLIQVQRAGFEVPRSVVLLLPEGADAAEHVAGIRGELGCGPLVVRSSAPDEDTAEPTPGRYQSVVNAQDDLVGALKTVLDSYGSIGGPRAVLIQRQLQHAWIGVALREPTSRGGGVAIEMSTGSASAVTEGSRAELQDRLGVVLTKRWLGGRGQAIISPKRFSRLFHRAERLLGDRLNMEWAMVRRRMICLQIRAARDATETAGEPAAALASLVDVLQRASVRARTVVLSVDARTEFIGSGPITMDLLQDLFSPRGPLARAQRWIFPWTRPLTPEPSIVPIEGMPFGVTFTARPLMGAFQNPWVRMLRWFMPLRRSGLLKALDRRLRVLEEVPPSIPQTFDADGVAVSRRALLGEPAVLALAVSLLQSDAGSAVDDADPLFAQVPGAPNGRTDDALAWRAPVDLDVEQPRLGETEGHYPVLPASLKGTPLSSDWKSALGELRTRARRVLAAHAAHLRWNLLQAGVLHFGTPNPENVQEYVERLPAHLTLRQLEVWAAEGTPVGIDPAAERGFWVFGQRECEGMVNTLDACGAGDVVVVNVPTVKQVLSLPPDCVLLAAAGTRLCHAALVARLHGRTALFGAGAAVLALKPGDRVFLGHKGAWSTRESVGEAG